MTPTREQVMPEPFGYVSDWFGGDGMRFQHKPWPELHCLTHSVAAVYSTVQMLRAIEDAYTAGRAQGLREAREACGKEAENFGGVAAGPFATDFGKHTHNAMAAGAKNCAAAIQQLEGRPR